MRYLRSIAFLVILTGIGFARPALAVVGDATGLFTITKTGFVLNRATNTFDTTVTIKNTSPFTVAAPIQLAVSGLPNGVTLKNAAGTTQGKPYVTVNAPGNSIIPNALVTSILLKFTNPARVTLTPTPFVYGDIPQAAVGLPPDPGPAGNVTVAGIDSNNNGVRDDLERYIGFTHPNSARIRAGLMQHAAALEGQLRAGGSQAQAMAAATQVTKGLECLNFLDPVNRRDFSTALSAQFLNTRLRVQALKVYEAHLAGKMFRGTPDAMLGTTCNFNIQALPN